MLQNYSFYSISAIFYYGFLCKNTHSHISKSTLQLFMCAGDVKYFTVFFFIFSILFSNFALATVRNAPTLNTLPRSCAIKREWGESPRLSRSCEPPLSTGANERTTEAMLWEGVRVWAASQKTCRNSFADGVIAVRLADWARMTATLTLYK